jgi:hypothetical protein
MSFIRLTADDFVVSTDAISATAWTTGNPTLSTFFTSSTQENGSSGDYYLNIFNTGSDLSGSAVQFAIAYGNSYGSGSLVYNTAVDGRSPSSTIYGQWQDLVIGDENTDWVFGNVTSEEFFALPLERTCYKESIFLGSLTLKISGSGQTISITDNSQYVSSIQFNEAGRVFQLISGSAGEKNESINTDGFTSNSGSYGWLLPDIGTIILNPLALSAPAASGGAGFVFSGSVTGSVSPIVSPMSSLYQSISGSGTATADFTINSQENITSDFIFVRPRSSEFNYSANPSFISGSTGEVLYSSFINNPQTFITTIGLYNDTNELLAVAKLSRPLNKNFTKEALVRVKLDF